MSRLTSDLPLWVFRCVAYVHIHNHNRDKLDPRAIKCVFLGYSPTQKGYKCFDPNKNHFFVTMDVTFFESVFSVLLLRRKKDMKTRCLRLIILMVNTNIKTTFNLDSLNKQSIRPTLELEHKPYTMTINKARFNDVRLFGKTCNRGKHIQSEKDASIPSQCQESNPAPEKSWYNFWVHRVRVCIHSISAF